MENIQNNPEIILIKKIEDMHFQVGTNVLKKYVLVISSDSDQSGELTIEINGSNSRIDILGIILGTGKQRIKLKTRQIHNFPESISNLHIRSIMMQESFFLYEGLIRIEKSAQRSDAFQKNENLILSKGAKVETRPYLEILANDVRCTHASTVAKLDSDALYYLSSRGLRNSDAQMLLVEGYFADIINQADSSLFEDGSYIRLENKVKQLL